MYEENIPNNEENELIDEDNYLIGRRIRDFAKARGWSLAELSRKIGMEPQSLNKYVPSETQADKKISKPGSEILQRLASVGCDMNWLLTGKTDDGGFVFHGKVKAGVVGNNSTANIYENENKLKEQLGDLYMQLKTCEGERDNLRKEVEQLRAELQAK